MRGRTRRWMAQAALLALVATAAVAIPTTPAAAATVPAGFTDQVVAAVLSPTAMAFLPDGRLLVTTQPGQLRVIQNDVLVATAALTLTVCSNSERGLLGVAVDPAFGTTNNNWIYLYYTANAAGTCVNRVSKFAMTGNTVDPTSEVTLVDNMPSTAGNHNGGDVHFGNDGLLYISIGDGGCDYKDTTKCGGQNTASRDQNILLGKILRITKDGGIPAGNPFQGSNSARCNVTGRTTANKCQETFAWGLRNPFRFAFDPNVAGAKFHINDVGQNLWEEIDLGTAGADFGWNVREGHCANGSTTDCGPPPSGMTNPIFDYGRGTENCASITGGAFVPTGAWPAPYSGAYLFADYVCGRIFRLVDNGNGTFSRVDFVTDLGGSSATSLTFGPSPTGQSLYYTSYADGGTVHRINATSGNRPPTAAIGATPASGPLPLHVSFTSTGSNDPDSGDTLSYRWTFGDGSPVDTTSGSTATHDYTTAGVYTASLTVVDNHGAASQPANATITAGNRAPQPTITAPSATTTFKVGQQITLQGSATDPEDGTVPASRLEWTVIKHHDTHTHPFLGPVTGATATFTAPSPEDLLAAGNSYLEIQLKATDSAGLSTTVTQDLQPRKVDVTFATVPGGLTLEIGGTPITAPQTFVSWVGYGIEAFAPSPQGAYRFRKWSDRGAQRHTMTTPKSASTLTATFKTG